MKVTLISFFEFYLNRNGFDLNLCCNIERKRSFFDKVIFGQMFSRLKNKLKMTREIFIVNKNYLLTEEKQEDLLKDFKTSFENYYIVSRRIDENNKDMSLNPLMRIVKSTLNRDPIEEIFWGNPTAETYTKVLTNYKMFPIDLRFEINERCIKKLSKPKEFDMVIANLALLQKLMKIDKITLPNTEPEVLESSKKKEIIVSEKSFVKFYFNFLKRYEEQCMNKLVSIDNKATFCEAGLNKCLDIIKNNIVIDYCLQHTTNQVTLRIALKEIFDDIKNDLEFTISFINENIKAIYEQSSETSFAINEVYETLLFVTKNIHKITVLIKKAGLHIPLPQYQMNKEVNIKIEMEMNSRKNEKTKFKTEKLIKSKKHLEDQEDQDEEENTPQKNKTYQSLSEIDEDEIFIFESEAR